MDLTLDRKNTIEHARKILDTAKAENRELTTAEQATVEADMDRIKKLDEQIRGRNLVKSVLSLGGQPGPWPDPDGHDDRVQYLSLRTPGMKSDLTARYGATVGSPGTKALFDVPDSPYTTIPMAPEIVRLGEAPTSLIEVLPAVTRPVTYRYMRQTTRTNNAAAVATGALKPTSVYGLSPVEGRLHVIAHLSEPIDKYVLQDGPSLASFVQLEMVSGLHQAVETQLLNGDGLGQNLTGLANTSGIQTQAFTTSPVLTARAAVTKVEVLGFEPYYYVLNPTDWEKVETTTLSAGQYVLNAEGTRSGVPVDSAARRLWGIPVTVTTAVPAGTGYLLSNGVAQVATDGALQAEQSAAYADDFGRNQLRLRVEGRFDLAVTRPMGVVKMALVV